MLKQPVRIYFLCIQNRCRSQIAEAFARHYGGDQLHVASAGLEESEIHPLTIEVMREVGIDLSSQYSKKLDMKFFIKANVVVKVCEKLKERCPIVPFGIKNVEWDIADPLNEGTIEAVRAARDEIETNVKELVSSLLTTKTT
jgi:arsenate reductase